MIKATGKNISGMSIADFLSSKENVQEKSPVEFLAEYIKDGMSGFVDNGVIRLKDEIIDYVNSLELDKASVIEDVLTQVDNIIDGVNSRIDTHAHDQYLDDSDKIYFENGIRKIKDMLIKIESENKDNLSKKSNKNHTHTIGEIDGLNERLDKKLESVNDIKQDFDLKSNTIKKEISNIEQQLGKKADRDHKHSEYATKDDFENLSRRPTHISGGARIDDSLTTANATWSSEKIEAEIIAGGGGGGGAVTSVNAKTGVVVLDTGDIAEITNKKYVTDAEKTKLTNTSGTNTGDQVADGVTITGTGTALDPFVSLGGGGGGGDVIGPLTATADNIAVYNGATGKLIKDGGKKVSDFALALGSDDNYVTDAEKIKLNNTSGTNTGDQTLQQVFNLGNTITFASGNGIVMNTDSTTAQAINIATSKFGVQSKFDISGGYAAYFDSNGIATASASNGVVRIRQATTGNSGAALILDNLGTSLTLDVKQSGTTVASVSASGTITGYNLSGTNTGDQDLSGYQLKSEKGVANGYAELDSGGKVPTGQLPSYVDDVIEVANFAALPGTGETGKIYVTLDTNLTYRWSGSAYVEISASLALGETASTAYRGDRGKTAYDHTFLTNNPHAVTKSQVGLGSVVNADTTTTANIIDSSNKRFVTDANLTTIGNQSGTNTGDNATNTQYSGLAASKENTITAGTTSQYRRGDKTRQTLDKSAVGLGNIDNTTDLLKPISTATQTALNLKANLASPTFTGTVVLPAGQVVNGVTLTTAGVSTKYLNEQGVYATPAGGGGGGQVDSVVGGTGIDVDATDPVNPIANLDSATVTSLGKADTAIQNLAGLGITSTAAELNILDGATLTVTELNYVDGVTSSIQTQLDGKAASLGANDNYVTDAQLVVIGNTSGTNTGDQNLSGYVTLTGTETLTNKTLTSPIIGTISNTGTITVPTTTGTLALVKPRVVTIASSSTITINADITDNYTVTALSANITINAPTGTLQDGQKLLIRIQDNGTARTIGWDAIYRAMGADLPLNTVVGEELYVGMQYNSSDTKWDVIATNVGGGGGGGSPGGSDNQIQYKNGSSFAGATNVEINNNSLNLKETVTPTAPTAGHALFNRTIANRNMPAFMGTSGLDSILQPFLARNKVGYWCPPGNATTVPGVLGFTAPTVTGFTATARNITTTNLFNRMRRLGYTTIATAGTVGHWRVAVYQFTVGNSSTQLGGFTYIIRFGISDPATVSDARMFIGMRASATPTNVEPSTITNGIGVGHGASDTNMKLFYGGSSAQTAIDLGVNFPITANSVNVYELALFSPPNSGDVSYQVTRLDTGNVATGKIVNSGATVLPTNTTLLAPRGYRTNNATALAVGLDVMSAYIETDY